MSEDVVVSLRERKFHKQLERRDRLLKMQQHVGFGDADGDLNRVEYEIAKHLGLAYEMLKLLTDDRAVPEVK